MRPSRLVVAALLGACTTPDPVVDNAAPTASITAPADGVTVRAGVPVTFVGAAADPDDAAGQLTASWTVDDAPLCPPAAPDPQGVTTCEAVLPVGQSAVTLRVVDRAGAQGTDTIAVIVQESDAPTVAILEPVPGSRRFYADVPIALVGTAVDDDDPPDRLVAAWRSDLDGDVGGQVTPDADGFVRSEALLSEGEHGLTLLATDSDGKIGQALVRVRVGPANSPPSCRFVEPVSGGAAREGTAVTFRAIVADADMPASELDIVLSSDRDGVLGALSADGSGEVSYTSDALTLGTHRVRLEVTDEIGATCAAELLWTVGEPPMLTVVDPVDGAVINEGELLPLRATVTDALHDPTALLVGFASSRDGELLAGAPDGEGAIGGGAAGLSVGAHELVVRATNPDGLYAEQTLTFRVNGLPTAADVSLAPSDPRTADDLVVSIDADATDPDGDALTYRYAWSVDGAASDASAGPTLSATATRKGQLWSVAVVATDGTGEGPAAGAEVRILNTLPVATVATVSPDRATTSSALTCSAGGLSDADGDTVSVRYSWQVDGADIGFTSAVLPASETARGQSITCAVTPDDGEGLGDPVASDAVVVANSAPSIDAVTISPDPASASDVLTCGWVGFTDADGDDDRSRATWTVNGAEAGSGPTLSGAFVRDDVVTCTVVPSDGDLDGESRSSSVTIRNSAPSVASVVITPDPAFANDDLTCSYDGFDDADGDRDASTIAWFVDGDRVAAGEVLEAGAARKGQTVTCAVTPFDGVDAGDEVSASVRVSNSVPSIAAVFVSPSDPGVDDTLTCDWTGFEDADGDRDESTARWLVDGDEVGTGATLRGAFAKGQTVTCEVAPFDGEDRGDPSFASVEVRNTAPVAEDLGLSPEPAFTSTILVADLVASDADRDDLDLVYTWWIDGEDLGVEGPELDGETWFFRDDTVEVRAVASDGEAKSAELRAAVTIRNSPPSASSVSISPDSPSIEDEVTCALVGFTDADGDADRSAIVWRLGAFDGEIIGEGPVLGMGVERGVTVFCVATPFDGLDEGEPVHASVRGANTAPEVLAVTLSPASPRTDDTIRATVDAYDADGDALALSYTWFVDGAEIDATGPDLAGEWFSRDQSVSVTVVASDGDKKSAPFVSDKVVVINTAPTIASATITPGTLRVETVATCGYAGFADADRDADKSTVAWRVGDKIVSTAATLTVGDVAKRGDTLVCEATPFDGSDEGDVVTASRAVENTAPVVGAVSLSPSDPVTTDVIVATATATDADGDGVTLAYTWYIDGEKVDATGASLSASLTRRDQRIYVVVTASDGAATSAPITSATVTIANSAPTAEGVAISPARPRATDAITCAVVGFSDLDGDKDATTFAWSVDGEGVGGGAALPVAVKRDQVVTCVATPFDGLDFGEAVEGSTTVINSAPVVTSLSIVPSTLRTDTVAGYTFAATDADGDSVKVDRVEWTVNGEVAGAAATLDGASAFSKGDAIRVGVVASDGSESAAIVWSATLTVLNTAPSEPKLAFDPEKWDWSAAGDGLGCEVDEDSLFDADFDTLSLSYVWTVAGAEVDSGKGYPPRLDSKSFSGGDVVSCAVTVSDGSESSSAKIEIEIPDDETRAVDWASIWWPCKGETKVGETFTVYGRVYMKGETDVGGERSELIFGQLGYAFEGADPAKEPDAWTWVDGEFHLKDKNDEEWVATIAPKESGRYDYAWRFTADDRKTWVIGDLAARPGERDWCIDRDIGGSDDGYDSATAGKLDVR